ncbi:MAG: DUF5305 domain-containing protein [Lachnospiraceae bacterium]|nr:DUF5305 domain-containing protein [Lachnospiraceae bacterium]
MRNFGSSENGIISITENIPLNIQEYNNLILDFEQTYSLAVDATLNISLQIKTTADLENSNSHVVNVYNSNSIISLGEKTTTFSGKLVDNVVGQKVLDVKSTTETKFGNVLPNALLLLASVLVITYIVRRTEESKRVNSDYRIELNRILRAFQDKIVQIKTNVDVTNDIIDVKDFSELIKLSEEIFKPILYWDSKKEEAYFYILANNATYRFILKI